MIHGGVELREKLGQQGFLSATTKFSTKILKEKYVALYNKRKTDSFTLDSSMLPRR